MTEPVYEKRWITAEDVQEAADQLSPQYNYDKGYVDGVQDASAVWKRAIRIYQLAVAIAVISLIVSSLLDWHDVFVRLGWLP